MNNIDVFIYSYKGKNIKDTISSLFENVSQHSKINLWLVDQHPIDRTEQIGKRFSVKYSHVFWDSNISPCIFKKESCVNTNADYMLILGDSVFLSKDWDIRLIEFINNRDIVVSGNKKIKISNKNNFYISKTYEDTEDFILNQFIDRNLIFAKGSLFKKINYPDYLKYNGEEETLSLDLFTSGVDIFAAPTDIAFTVNEDNINSIYVPFSLNHNYNEVIRLFKYGHNKFISIKNRNMTLLDFSKYHNFDFSSLSELPFYTNDVSYNPNNLNFNQVDARKFVARTKAIH